VDWGIFAQATVLLAITLLAVVITIFVFASSLLGRAVEASAKEQEKLRVQQRKEISKRLREAQEVFDSLKGVIEPEQLKVEEARKSLEDLQKQQDRFDKQSKAIERAYRTFTIKGGITYPGACFVSSIILSGFAWSLAQGSSGFWIRYSWIPISALLWGLALVAMGCGVHRLYLSLKKIQDLALTSEETWLSKIIEGYKLAQREIETERKPELKLKFISPMPPFRIKREGEVSITFRLWLAKGEKAEGAQVVFLAPPGFVLDGDGWTIDYQSASVEAWPNYIRAKYELGYLFPEQAQDLDLHIEAPPNEGNFTLTYRLRCFQFLHQQDFDVVVTP